MKWIFKWWRKKRHNVINSIALLWVRFKSTNSPTTKMILASFSLASALPSESTKIKIYHIIYDTCIFNNTVIHKNKKSIGDEITDS